MLLVLVWDVALGSDSYYNLFSDIEVRECNSSVFVNTPRADMCGHVMRNEVLWEETEVRLNM